VCYGVSFGFNGEYLLKNTDWDSEKKYSPHKKIMIPNMKEYAFAEDVFVDPSWPQIVRPLRERTARPGAVASDHGPFY